MNEDQHTYKRAAGSALVGLTIQVVITAVLLIMGLWAGGHWALYGAMVHALGGIGIWICLWLVYQQHRLEREESLEAEQLAQRHGADSSIFEVGADDLSVARRRLNWMYKWIMPGISLATAVYLLVLGVWLAQQMAARLADPQRLAPEQTLPLLTGAAAIGLVAFLVSRYLAGMARVPQWQLLGGGATYLMGNVLVAALLAAAFALSHFDFHALLQYMTLVVPVLMAVIGVEMSLNLVLNFYRPRRRGEVPRPAFESRLLGLLTTPESIAKTINDTINYQFGFEVTRSWFWQLLSRTFVSLVLFAAAVLVAFSSVVIVNEGDRAVVTRFGALYGEPLGAGMHLKLPWPLERAHYYDVERVRTIKIGSEPEPDVAVLWTNPHAAHAEEPYIVAPPQDRYVDPRQNVGLEDQLLIETSDQTPDVFVVNAELVIRYSIDGNRLVDYLMSGAGAGAGEMDRRLQMLANREFARHLLNHDIDAWIGAARVNAGPALREAIQEQADRNNLGIEIHEVMMPSVHPPQDVAGAFHQVVGAEQRMHTTVERAEQEAIEILASVAGSRGLADRIVQEIEAHEQMHDDGADDEDLLEQELLIERLMQRAGGNAAVRIAEARGERWEREQREAGRADQFAGQLRAYEQAPDLFRARRYMEVVADGLLDSRKVLLVGEREHLTIRGDLKDVDGGFDAALDVLQERQEEF